jgi:hypothetical protein
LQAIFPEIYSGNNDLSYFFIYRSLEALVYRKGVLSFILPKYLLQSVYADKIRRVISNRSRITEIHDLTNCFMFTNVKIKNIILFLKKEESNNDYEFIYFRYQKEKNSISRRKLTIKQSNLDPEKWIFLDPIKLKLLKRLENLSNWKLIDIVNISKGIETGCDRIFAPSSKQFFTKTMGFNKSHVKKWIKGKDIKRFKLIEREREVLYAPYNRKNEIKSDEKLMEYLRNNKDQLLDRSRISEYYLWRKGDERNTMKYFHPKILTPYKSSKNTFAIDFSGSLSSKDVIWLIPKNKNFKKKEFLQYLVGLLNSEIITFYSLSTFKDLGGIFEFYPKQIQMIPIRIINIQSPRFKTICGLVENLTQESNKNKIKYYQEQLNTLFYQIYDLNKQDIKLIKDFIESIGQNDD